MLGSTLDQCVSEPVDRSRLTTPSVELSEFVRSVADDLEPARESRESERFPAALEAVCVPFDGDRKRCGDAVLVVTRNISVGGLSLVHTRPIPADFLLVEVYNGEACVLKVILEVLRCRRLGRFFEIAGQFEARL